MMSQVPGHVIGIPPAHQVRRAAIGFLPAASPAPHPLLASLNGSLTSIKQRHPVTADKSDSVMNKSGKKTDNFVQGVREHVKLAPKISETVKGKLGLGARILKHGGVLRVFKQLFSVREGEKLLKASLCYLSTTTGPIAGLLFISTDKLAFCSDRPIKVFSPEGDMVRVHYKVSVPLRKIMNAFQSENVGRPSQKYIEIVTVDDFDFWFMGFLNYKKTLRYVQLAISQAS